MKTALHLFCVLTGLHCGFAGEPCELLAHIKSLPMKGERVDDPSYNRILAEGEQAIPCLIKKISDSTRMPDPRHAPAYDRFATGDLAVIMLTQITGRPFEDQLPETVRAKYRTSGVYAYFEFVATEANRKALQRNWEAWLERRSK